MMRKLPLNQWVKAATASWWSSLAKSPEQFFFYLLIFFLPTQLGKHFWPTWSYVYGQRVDYLSPTLYVTDMLIGVLFVYAIFRNSIKIHLMFLIVVFYLSLTVFFSQNPFAGWYFLLKFLEMSFVGFYISRDSAFLSKKMIGVAFSFGIVGESLLAMFQFFLQRSVGGLFYLFGERTFSGDTPGIANASIHGTLLLRPYGTFSHPNVLAGYVLISMLLVWYFLQTDKSPWKKILLGTSLLFGSLGMLVTLSRVTILLSVGIASVLILRKLHKKYLVGFLGLLTLVLILFPTLFYRFAPNTFEGSAAAREQLLQASLRMISSHPLLGVGLGNFLPALPPSSLLQPVHNMLLLWASETGVVGILLFFIACSLFIRKLFFSLCRVRKEERSELLPLLLALLSIVCLGMFDHYFLTLQQGQLLFALVVGILAAHLNK